MNDLEPTFTLPEVADHFKVNEKTVRRWVRLGQISARRVGRKLCFTRRDIELAARGK